MTRQIQTNSAATSTPIPDSQSVHIAHTVGWPKTPLASAPQVSRKALAYVGMRIPVDKVVRPTREMSVDIYQMINELDLRRQ